MARAPLADDDEDNERDSMRDSDMRLGIVVWPDVDSAMDWSSFGACIAMGP